MSASFVMQFAALAITIFVGAYAVHLMRRTHTTQETIVRATSAAEDFQKLQPQFISFLRRIESHNDALQKIALQVEVALAALKESINTSMSSATERQIGVVENLRDHIDTQEDRLAKILDLVSDSFLSPPPHQNSPEARYE